MTPTQRHTKSRKRKRRSAISLKTSSLSTCPKCKRVLKAHTACAFCGTYKGQNIINIKLKKAERKKRAQEENDQKKLEKKKEKEGAKK
ncbi:MAG: 50S ribosomal protein L32 [Patescibacteria group bacterium]